MRGIGIRFGMPRMGDLVEGVLKKVGITEDRMARWLGRPCGCKERREKLNRLSEAINKSLGLSDEEAKKVLDDVVKEDETK